MPPDETARRQHRPPQPSLRRGRRGHNGRQFDDGSLVLRRSRARRRELAVCRRPLLAPARTPCAFAEIAPPAWPTSTQTRPSCAKEKGGDVTVNGPAPCSCGAELWPQGPSKGPALTRGLGEMTTPEPAMETHARLPKPAPLLQVPRRPRRRSRRHVLTKLMGDVVEPRLRIHRKEFALEPRWMFNAHSVIPGLEFGISPKASRRRRERPRRSRGDTGESASVPSRSL